MKIEKVFVSQSDYGTCLRWEQDGLRYHIWNHDLTTVFKNPPESLMPRTPGYFHTRHLDATNKVNAAMVAEAQRIAKEQGLYESATEAMRQKEAEEEARYKAVIILGNKRNAAEEMYEVLEFALAELNNMTTTQFSLGKDKAIRDRIRTALAKADGSITAPVA